MTLSTSPAFVRDRFTWLAYLMLAYYAYTQSTLGPLMPFLRAELQLNYTVAGFHLSAFALGMVLAGLTGDGLARRFGRPLLFWGGGAGMGAGALGLALSGHVVLTIGSVLVMGYLGSLMLVMIQSTLADRHGEQRTIALTESNIAASVLAVLAPAMVGGLQRLGLGWRGALFLTAVAFGLMFLAFLRAAIPPAPPAETDPESSANPRRVTLPLSFWAYWAVICLGVSIEWCLIFWGADFLENVVGYSKVNAATLMSVFFVAMVLGRVAGSWLSRRTPGALLLLATAGIALTGFPIFWLAPVAWLNVLGLFITGIGVANFYPLSLAMGLSVAPRQADAASARASLGAGMAILISPLMLGWLADQLGIKDAYGIVVVLAGAATALTFFANRRATRRLKRAAAAASPD